MRNRRLLRRSRSILSAHSSTESLDGLMPGGRLVVADRLPADIYVFKRHAPLGVGLRHEILIPLFLRFDRKRLRSGRLQKDVGGDAAESQAPRHPAREPSVASMHMSAFAALPCVHIALANLGTGEPYEVTRKSQRRARSP